MIQLYGAARSRAGRCLWALAEVNVPHEHIDIDLEAKQHRTAKFLALNPLGKVPVLVDGEQVLRESLAINLYLVRRYGRQLWPTDEWIQAQVLQWSFFGISEVEPNLVTVGIQKMFTPPERRDPQRLAEAQSGLGAALATLEQQLGRMTYLCGARFGAADLNVASVLVLSQVIGIDLSAWPRVRDWLGACYDRPAYRRTFTTNQGTP